MMLAFQIVSVVLIVSSTIFCYVVLDTSIDNKLRTIVVSASLFCIVMIMIASSLVY
jgi:hypothetical protein